MTNKFMSDNPPTKFKSPKELSKSEAEIEIKELVEAIRHHDNLYYNKDKPVISDSIYDRLFHRLLELENAYPELKTSNSPTMRVGGGVIESFKKVKHAGAMLSVNSSLEELKVLDFFDSINKKSGKNAEFVLEPKFDGFSLEVVYEEGVFKYASTRGNGSVGEDVSHNILAASVVPLKLKGSKTPEFLSIRGEVYMEKNDFLELNKRRSQEGKDLFANPRNASAGMMRQLDSGKLRGLKFKVVFYDVLNMKGEISLRTHDEIIKALRMWGLRVSDKHAVIRDFSEIKTYYESFVKEREDIPYEADGVVIKVNDLSFREELGVRSRSPRWAYAWKFPPKEEFTIVEDIIVSVGRTGTLTPLALLDPVVVGGVTVSRATLHNEDYVKSLGVRKGDTVKIIRAGDVIPEVKAVIKSGGGSEFKMPKSCPSCASAVFREGAYWFCPNALGCLAQLKGHIKHYASRNALDIEGLGESVAQLLVEEDLVKNISDLYELTPSVLEDLEGFASLSAKQLYQAIQSSKSPLLHRFLYALGIRHVGERVALVLSQHFGSLNNIMNVSMEELISIHEIGPQIAQGVYEFFRKDSTRGVLDKLSKCGVRVQETKIESNKNKTLNGLKFVLTGELKDFKRDVAKREIENRGGRVTSSVSKSTDYVLLGDNPGSKLSDAKKLNDESKAGIKIIDEEEFVELLKK